jgi:hypothetical protein
MKTTIDLPDDLVREVKLRALMQGRTLRDVVADYIRQGLGAPAPTTPYQLPPDSPMVMGPDGFPVFIGRPDAPATKMSIEELLALEQEALYGDDINYGRNTG